MSVWQPEYKDWNEDLKARYGVTPIPAQEHPKLEALPVICMELYDTCKFFVSKPQPGCRTAGELREAEAHDGKLKIIPGIGSRHDGASAEHSGGGPACRPKAIPADGTACSPSTSSSVTCRTATGPTRNRGMMRSRADDLQKDITAVSRQLNTAGLRSPEDKQSAHRILPAPCAGLCAGADFCMPGRSHTDHRRNLPATRGQGVFGNRLGVRI